MPKGDNGGHEELRKRLIELRGEILHKITQEMGAKLDEDPRMSTISTMDIGDLSNLELDDAIDYTIMSIYIERLLNVEDALDRLEQGTYVYCEDCDRPIKLERLRILPFTKYCVRCQEQREKGGRRVSSRN